MHVDEQSKFGVQKSWKLRKLRMSARQLKQRTLRKLLQVGGSVKFPRLLVASEDLLGSFPKIVEAFLAC
jgi:hypothetical protein